jgi:hypothetical protein
MRILVSLISFLFTLVGCNPQPGITTMTFSSVDGVGINSTKSRISDGEARFECLKSATGNCHYLVFVDTCAATEAAAADAACTPRVLQRFTLAAGKVKELHDLPAGVRHCLDHEAMPTVPVSGKG